ncbi:hypothetical protein RR46_01986 [Papilio xuthus]|uniref:Uncharacterized protein n=1 Tax=Papilio xuthus TaxID=66420 RepID=A0A194QP22_PAPXU|nr:hypothetical protein RR46_01986 [Papilio xuthus]
MPKRSAEDQISHYERKIRKLREREIGQRRHTECLEQSLAPQNNEPEPVVEPDLAPDPDPDPLPDTRGESGDPELESINYHFILLQMNDCTSSSSTELLNEGICFRIADCMSLQHLCYKV